MATGEVDFDGGPPQTRRHDEPTEPGEAELEKQCEDGDEDGTTCHLAEVRLRPAVENEPAEPLQAEVGGDGGRRNDLQGGASDSGDHERKGAWKLHPEQDLPLGVAHSAGRAHRVRVGVLNACIGSGEYRWHGEQDEHHDGGQDVDELPGDHRRDDQEEQHQQPKRRQRTQRVREPGDHCFAPSGVADHDSQRDRDHQRGQQRDGRVQQVVADLHGDAVRTRPVGGVGQPAEDVHDVTVLCRHGVASLFSQMIKPSKITASTTHSTTPVTSGT